MLPSPRTARYSGRLRPAWRMNHTGMREGRSPRAAARSGGRLDVVMWGATLPGGAGARPGLAPGPQHRVDLGDTRARRRGGLEQLRPPSAVAVAAGSDDEAQRRRQLTAEPHLHRPLLGLVLAGASH